MQPIAKNTYEFEEMRRLGTVWQNYLVLHFIFSGVSTSNLETFRKSFALTVEASLLAMH